MPPNQRLLQYVQLVIQRAGLADVAYRLTRATKNPETRII